MAATISCLCAKRLAYCNSNIRKLFTSGRRGLLSVAYRCTDSWNKRLSAPVFQSIKDTSDFAIGLRDNFDKTGSLSAIDMDLLANRLEDIPSSQLDYMEEIFQCFGRTQSVLEMSEATVAALVRAYIHHGHVDRLLAMVKDKVTYRIFLDHHSCNILLDHLINLNMIPDAVSVCHENMLQENFAHPTTRLLALYVCSLYIDTVPLKPPEVVKEAQNEEEDWEPVGYINNPHFDFHFDLTDEKMLLGKIAMYLSHELSGPALSGPKLSGPELSGPELSGPELGGPELGGPALGGLSLLNLEIIGNAYFESFDTALELLEKCAWNPSGDDRIHQNILDRVRESLEDTATRDPDSPTKEPGFLRNEDDRDLHRPSPQEKDAYLQRLEIISEHLRTKNLIDEQNFHESIRDSITAQLKGREPIDIAEQNGTFDEWMDARDKRINAQLKEQYVKQKKDEIVAKLKELEEKEELLTYFEKKHQIKISASKVPKERERIDPDVLRQRRLRRRRVRIAACPTG